MRCSFPGLAMPAFLTWRAGRLALFSERTESRRFANTVPLDCSLDTGVTGAVMAFDVHRRTSCSLRLCVDLT